MAGNGALDAARPLELLVDGQEDVGGGCGHRIQWRLLGAADRRAATNHNDAADVDGNLPPARAQRTRTRRNESARASAPERSRVCTHQRSDAACPRPQPRSVAGLLIGTAEMPMTVSFVARAFGAAAGALAFAVIAQPAATTTTVVPLDRVIAVVNDEALTQWDLREQKRIVLEQLKASNVPAPSVDVLDKQVLERLITERALAQFAKETGIRVDDTTVERTILRIAEENKLSPDEFRKVLERENIPYANYREDIRRQVVMQRLRDREVDSKILVTDAEVDNYLATVASQAGGEREYLLSHIYVTVPEQASADQIETRRRRAEDALAQIKSGKEFAEDRKSTRLNSSHVSISYAVFCLKKK